jgi:putative ABC transport system permease protein
MIRHYVKIALRMEMAMGRPFSREFVVLVAVANILAWPVVYIIMTKWLHNFAYRTNLSIWIFILSGLVVLAIALLTVSYQTIKAATANPVESLKYE